MFEYSTYFREAFSKNGITFQIWEDTEKSKFYCITFFSVDKGEEFNTIQEARKSADNIKCPDDLKNIDVNDCFVVTEAQIIKIGEYPKGELKIKYISSTAGKWWGAISFMEAGNGMGIPLTINKISFNSKNECIKYWIDHAISHINSEYLIKLAKAYSENLDQLTIF